MKKCAFVIPYYGSLPNYFQVFLNTCAMNDDFDWLLFTDDHTEYSYPPNVHVYYETFADMRERAQRCFDFKTSLSSPYKLCDYKPAYGLLFADYLREYLFWGHCDCDVIFGKLSHFITDEMLETYDKLFQQGHCTLYRNTPQVCKAFMLPLEGKEVYRNILSSPQNFTFDESYLPLNVNRIFDEHGFRVFKTDLSANTYSKGNTFRLLHYDAILDSYLVEEPNHAVYVWDKGVLSRFYFRFGQFYTVELMYMHFQRRHMSMSKSVPSAERFKILPGLFDEIEVKHVTPENFYSIRWRRLSFHRWRIFKADILFWVKRVRNKLSA